MVKLDRLVNILGSHGATVCCCPPARDTELHSVIVHDPTDSRTPSGDVFLAIGLDSPTEAIRLAGQAGAVILVLRAASQPDEHAMAEAQHDGVAVALVDPAISWSELSGVAYGLILEGRETEAGRGPTDLFALADALAASVGDPVTIEDQQSRVMAYSGSQHGADRARLETILGRTVPAAVRSALVDKGVFRHLEDSDEPLFVEPMSEQGLSGRLVVAVRAGDELLGSVWVESNAPGDEHRRKVLKDGSRTAALHLLRARASADLERHIESDLVTHLLEGTADAPAVLSRLGLTQDHFRVIALHAHAGDEQHAAALLAFERATTGFGWARRGRCTLFGTTVYTVLPCGADPSPACDWVADLVDRMPVEADVCAGIGGSAEAVQLPASRQEADESLALHVRRSALSPAVVYGEAWDEILRQRLRTAAAAGRAPARGPVADLARHDEEHATRYVATLRAWLDAQADVHEAASRLGVHPNTVRYRMRRMSEVTSLELDRADKRLAMIIALEVTEHGRQ